jgi:hypothetical protein
MKKIACICLVYGALFLCCASQSLAAFIDFESGTDWDAVGWVASGVQMVTLDGDDLIYADIDEGWNFKSDNGKQAAEWEHFISGDVAVVSPYDNVALVNFTQSISHFKIGYSSWYEFVVEAYDAEGNLIGQNSGVANSGHWNGTGVSYLDICCSSGDISSVKLYAGLGDFSEPGWWVVDNMTYEYQTNPAIPEWPCAILGSTGLLLIGRLRRFRP